MEITTMFNIFANNGSDYFTLPLIRDWNPLVNRKRAKSNRRKQNIQKKQGYSGRRTRLLHESGRDIFSEKKCTIKKLKRRLY
ncbi:17747_t:CDS:2 [Cetraspora pellucida]|uniref:17747_t:CDS:1 n=1 Tax=Cetraspora pellucida TaxID=1433469 RepID=A0A9N9AA54_9GLOM|nr:17747_t:CDS:2 [Cetraspora pellucida]